MSTNAGSSSSEIQATSTRGHRVRVAHSYTPKNEDELQLVVGEIMFVSNKVSEMYAKRLFLYNLLYF